MKEIQIPEKHLNEVKALYTKMEDDRKNKEKATRKLDLAKDTFWDKVHDILPETEGESCAINSDEWSVKVKNKEEQKSSFLASILSDLGN